MIVRASIVIVSYNGLEFLTKCLHSVLRAVERDGGDHEVIVVDNASSDDGARFVAESHPAVKVLRLPENRGAAAGYNAGAREARGDVIVALHHDILLEDGFLRPLLLPFRDEAVFAVTSKLLHGNGLIEQLHLRFKWVNGLFDQVQPGLDEPDGAVPAAAGFTCYAPLCNSAYRRDRFLALGGFPESYGGLISASADADLCYRAWKRGWNVLFEPASRAQHLRAHSWWSGDWQVVHEQLMEGAFLLVWANVTDPDMWREHLSALPKILFVPDDWIEPYREVLRLLVDPDVTPRVIAERLNSLSPLPAVEGAFLRGFMRAFPKLPVIVERRIRERPHLKRTDREVLALVGA